MLVFTLITIYNMSPKKQAEELIQKFIPQITLETSQEDVLTRAKECSLILVDVLMPIIDGYEEALGVDQQSDYLEYWKSVKQEIKNL